MLGNTHRAFGLAASTACLLAVQRWAPDYLPFSNDMAGNLQLAVTEASVVAASTLPDIDKALGLTHRGITHTIWIPLGMLAGLWYAKLNVTMVATPYILALLMGLIMGYFFHLLGDAFSAAGIAWFYPLQNYQRYGSGAFHVKGFRGPFLPLYSVGNKVFWFVPILWWGMAIGLNILLWGRIANLI